MTIIAYVGCIDQRSSTIISGNGKTLCMTGVGWLNKRKFKRKIWSNYETDFSDEVMSFQEMIDTIGTTPHPELELLVTEMGKIINSLGTKTREALYIETFARQLRKVGVNLSYDEQRFNSLHKRLREFTDVIFMPQKYHTDRTICNYPQCAKEHLIYLYSYDPPIRKHRAIFHAPTVGQHYDTNQICLEELHLKKKKKNEDEDD